MRNGQYIPFHAELGGAVDTRCFEIYVNCRIDMYRELPPYLVTFPGVAAYVGLTNRSLLYTFMFSPSSSFSLSWSARWRRTWSRSSSACRMGRRWMRDQVFSRAYSLWLG